MNELEIFSASIYWQPGPAMGVDVLSKEPTEENENPSGIECGDRLLVLVEAHDPLRPKKYYWDSQVIVATETGFNDQNGDPWSAWGWDDVSWWVKLNKNILPPLKLADVE